jgi:hypothetical protein
MKIHMKKSIIYNLVFMLLLWACSSSFLEEPPRGFLAESQLESEAGVNTALLGAYSLLDGMNLDNNNTWSANPWNWQFGTITSDDSYKGSEQTDFPEMTQLEIYQWTSGNAIMNDKWVQSYEGVNRANSTLKLLAKVTDISDADKKRIEGESRFLRAYYHFELYKVWGNVPYFTEEDEEFIKSNVGVDPLGDAIKDVEAAVPLLPATQAQRGRVDQFAAKAFLGKLYMYLETPDAAKAKAQLDPVVNAKSLAPCLKDIFQTATENHEEALFSVQASTNDGGNSRNANWLNQLAFPAGPAFGCCGFMQPSQDLVNAYKVGADGLPELDFDTFDDADLDPENDFVDPRIDLTIGRDGVPFLDWGVHAPNWIRDRAFSGPYSPKKHIHYKAEPVSTGGWNNNANNGINYPVIRLADAILLLAEAEVLLGNVPRAEELVNMVRVRAGNCAQGAWVKVPDGADEGDAPDETFSGTEVIASKADINGSHNDWAKYKVEPYPTGTLTAENAMAAVRYERRLELALEGHRFFDLRRWKIAAQVLNNFVTKTKASRSYYNDAATYDETKHRWFPIPQNQINANTIGGEQILKQHPQW